jgi:hypothetical protein
MIAILIIGWFALLGISYFLVEWVLKKSGQF